MKMEWPKAGGHCMRCDVPFGDNATAFMVPIKIICEVIQGVGIYSKELSAVCDACVEPREQALTTRNATCPGCGQRMSVDPNARHRRAIVCSRRCQQRERRKRRYIRDKACPTCKTMFKPKRADAKFCSAACKQRAWRACKANAAFREFG
jgi:hypothetical protein